MYLFCMCISSGVLEDVQAPASSSRTDPCRIPELDWILQALQDWRKISGIYSKTAKKRASHWGVQIWRICTSRAQVRKHSPFSSVLWPIHPWTFPSSYQSWSKFLITWPWRFAAMGKHVSLQMLMNYTVALSSPIHCSQLWRMLEITGSTTSKSYRLPIPNAYSFSIQNMHIARFLWW